MVIRSRQLSEDTVISDDGMYRYLLGRGVQTMDESQGCQMSPIVVFIGLNPSTADEHTDDPTIRRCMGFMKAWGFTGMYMVNLFAYRATDPNELRSVADPVGPENDEWIDGTIDGTSDFSVAIWGTNGSYMGRGKEVAGEHKRLKCLGLTKGGHPKHPLYLRKDTELKWFPGYPVGES